MDEEAGEKGGRRGEGGAARNGNTSADHTRPADAHLRAKPIELRAGSMSRDPPQAHAVPQRGGCRNISENTH